MILVSGCSFLANCRDHGYPEVLTHRLGDDVLNLASAAGGNHYISQSIINTIINQHKTIDYVFVLWSGIMRVDIPVGINVRDQVGALNYDYVAFNNNRYWFHSGGFTGNNNSNSLLDRMIKLQYLESDETFLTQETDRHISTTAAVLRAYDIPYDFGSIYDYHQLTGNENCFGIAKLSKEKLHFDLSINTHPYEYCRDNNLLAEDNFHPTSTGLTEWLNSVKLKIDK